MNSSLSYISNLKITTLNEHIYSGGRPKGCAQSVKGFKWIANGSKEPKSKQSTKGESGRLPVTVSAQPPTLNSYNFCNSFPNQLQQALLESLEILFSYASDWKAFGATV